MAGNQGYQSGYIADTNTETTTNNTDSSHAFGGPQVSGQQQGSNFTVDGAGANITTVDPGAIAAGQAIAQQALQGQNAANLAVADDFHYALGRTLDLATASQQGAGGTIIKGVIALAGIAGLAWAATAFFGGKKKEPARA